MNPPPIVLCVTDYFLPGYRGGGPVTTLANMRLQLASKVTLAIFTRDRDLGAASGYEGVVTEQWTDTTHGPVYYASPNAFGPRGLRRAMAGHAFDAIYLNSFFSAKGAILPYLALRRAAPRLPILLAPRGEFSPGALAVKRAKKRLYLQAARLFGLYQDIYWHASTDLEAQDIVRQFPKAKGRILIASDPVSAEPPSAAVSKAQEKRKGQLRLAFISRISPMKNLDGLLRILRDVPVEVSLDIFGPIEDKPYWQTCADIISSLPANIQVTAHGPIAPDQVSATFARYDLFAFPTHGENFGHAIFEALRAGTPVLISDQTSWTPDETKAVTVVPLEDEAGWRAEIRAAAELGPDGQDQRRRAAARFAEDYAARNSSHRANLEMFHALLSECQQELTGK
ncbi:hypothetical protein B6V73_16565 [Thioclava sp. JM3]|uniref:glycosyltransferase n=1 Tax=Thioclava sp. JM3 TaxID=1973004 RepID=UPI000B53F17F|nr:glycosyltransferase [Thioclava sp. JM3]OWY14209.1 hypothetical protein B6V73_16565 [Thioclava sp. JM3]